MKHVITLATLLMLTGAVLAPISYMIFVAMREQSVFLQVGAVPFDEGWTLANFDQAIQRTDFFARCFVSVTHCVSVVLPAAVLGLPAAYSVSRLQADRQLRVSFSFLSVRMLPGIAVCLPVFWIFSQQGLMSSTLSYMVLQIGLNLPVLIWLAVPVFAAVPREIEELVVMDGLSRRRTIGLVILPLYALRLLGVLLIVGLLVWNETFFASLFRVETVTEVIPSLIAHRGVQWGPIMALGTLVTLPGLLLFAMLLFRRWQQPWRKGGR